MANDWPHDKDTRTEPGYAWVHGFGPVWGKDIASFYYDARRGADLTRYKQKRNQTMPRKKTPGTETILQSAAIKAVDKYKIAQDKADKSKVGADINEAVKLKNEMDKAVTAANRERFVSVVQPRANSIIKALRVLLNSAKPKTNEYSEADIAKIFGPIRQEVESVETRFKTSLTSPDISPADIIQL